MRLLVVLCLLEATRGEVVRARTGVYKGRSVTTKEGVTYSSFRGIKYASALRFQVPVPVEDSNKEFSAEEYGPSCLQEADPLPGVNETSPQAEDCLYLNVHAPDHCLTVSDCLPVMVFIHGGGFMSGDSAMYDPEYFMDTERVIYVTLQYRLGPFGFLDFNSPKYPSNLGFKDMVAALSWIQMNIRYFGGDPSRVTVQGESSGGVAVNLLLLSPLTKGLLRGGISQSGTGCQLYAVKLKERAREMLSRVVGRTPCPASSVPTDPLLPADSAAECLSQLTPRQLTLTVAFEMTFDDKIEFGAVIEKPSKDAFIIDYPWTAKTVHIPWISGVNSKEAQLATSPRLAEFLLETVRNGSFTEILSKVLGYEYTSKDPLEITKRIVNHYNISENITEQNLINILDEVLSNGSENYPNINCLTSYNYSKTWNYNFGFILSSSNATGVDHFEEMPFLFPLSQDVKHTGSPQDRAASEDFIRFFLTFAERQDPNPGNWPVAWEEFRPEKDRAMLFTNRLNVTDSFSMGPDPNRDSYKFWGTLPLKDAFPPL